MRKTEDAVPRRIEVAPGLGLTVCPTDRFKVGFFSVRFVLPASRDEAAVRSLLFKVLCRGTEKYPSMARLNLRLDEMYATPFGLIDNRMNGYANLGFTVDLLEKEFLLDDTDLFGDVLEVITQILYHPLRGGDGGLSEKYIEAERKNLTDQIRSVDNQPSGYAMKRFLDAFYGDGAYAHTRLLSEESVGAVSGETLFALWQRLIRDVPIECFYVGRMSAEEVAKELWAHFVPEIPAHADNKEAHHNELPAAQSVHASTPHTVEEDRAVGQSHLLIGCHTGVLVSSPEFYAMMLCNEIFGASPISRLFVHVREKRGLCYTCSSEYAIARGDLIIACGIRADRREEAQNAIFEQIEVMKAGDFTDAEFDAAKKSLDSSYRQLSDSAKGLSNYYTLRRLLGVGDSVEESRKRFAAVTREDVVRAASRICPDTIYFLRGTGNEENECGDGEDE